jgi:hypothetical protein
MTDNPPPAEPDLYAAASLGHLHWALLGLTHLVNAWTTSAATTRAKEGTDERHPDDARYARGLADGLDIAARQLAKHVPVLLAAIPPCPHGTTHDQAHCPRWCW